MWLRKERSLLVLEVLQGLLQVASLLLDFLQPFHQSCLFLEVFLLSLNGFSLDLFCLVRLLALVDQYATLELENSSVLLQFVVLVTYTIDEEGH